MTTNIKLLNVIAVLVFVSILSIAVSIIMILSNTKYKAMVTSALKENESLKIVLSDREKKLDDLSKKILSIEQQITNNEQKSDSIKESEHQNSVEIPEVKTPLQPASGGNIVYNKLLQDFKDKLLEYEQLVEKNNGLIKKSNEFYQLFLQGQQKDLSEYLKMLSEISTLEKEISYKSDELERYINMLREEDTN